MELRQELENQRTEFSQRLQNLREEVESERGALQQRLKDVERKEEDRRHQLEKDVAGEGEKSLHLGKRSFRRST